MALREIIFRGKRLDNGEWAEGYLEYYYSNDGCRRLSCYISQWGRCMHRVNPATVGQFTGLLDKNGKRIFEGDICRFREWSRGEMCWVGNVHYERQQFVISGGPNKECETPFCLQLSRFVAGDIEVIGTFHDNPELLEVSEK